MDDEKLVWIVGERSAATDAIAAKLESSFVVRVESIQRRPELKRETDLVVAIIDSTVSNVEARKTCGRLHLNPIGAATQIIVVRGSRKDDEEAIDWLELADDVVRLPLDAEDFTTRIEVQFALADAEKRLAELERRCESSLARTEEIILAQDAAIFALAELTDNHDPEMGEHAQRIRTYSQIIADQLQHAGPYREQVDAAFLDDLYRASPLHDVGNLGIADSILLKPGRLSDEEFEVVKQHVVAGGEMIEKASRRVGRPGFLKMAADVARYHHERFNGSGYCHGLSGEAIPLAARIVALADVYDALTSVRVYKPAYPAEVARHMIEDEAGRHFDPAIVDAFLARVDDFERVRRLGPETVSPRPPLKDLVRGAAWFASSAQPKPSRPNRANEPSKVAVDDALESLAMPASASRTDL